MADLLLPQLGETVTEGTITRWARRPGDRVASGDILYEVSTDKVDSEVPAEFDGVLTEIVAAEGATVAVGTVIARYDAEGAAPAPAGGGGRRGGAGGGGSFMSFRNTHAPRSTGLVRSPLLPIARIAAMPSRPPRGLSCGSFTMRNSSPTTGPPPSSRP